MRPLLLAALFLPTFVSAQQRMTREGSITFDATTPMEDISALSESASAVFDEETGQLGVQVLVTSFEFRRALMQEHFNESYLESDRYPTALFKGRYDQGRAKGTLTLHGVSREVDVPATLVMDNGSWQLNTTFTIAVADYNIAIPVPVKDKVASEVRIEVDCKLRPRK